jgi:ribosome-binding ATPase YchF (GTP1/OBG family)
MFMEDRGIQESARDRLTRFAYEMLGYISFFTVGPDEVRAWNLTRGKTAVEAAGTRECGDLRGVISLEVVNETWNVLTNGSPDSPVRNEKDRQSEGNLHQISPGAPSQSQTRWGTFLRCV